MVEKPKQSVRSLPERVQAVVAGEDNQVPAIPRELWRCVNCGMMNAPLDKDCFFCRSSK